MELVIVFTVKFNMRNEYCISLFSILGCLRMSKAGLLITEYDDTCEETNLGPACEYTGNLMLIPINSKSAYAI